MFLKPCPINGQGFLYFLIGLFLKSFTERLYYVFQMNVVQEIEQGRINQEACHKQGIQARSIIVQWLRNFATLIRKIKLHFIF